MKPDPEKRKTTTKQTLKKIKETCEADHELTVKNWMKEFLSKNISNDGLKELDMIVLVEA